MPQIPRYQQVDVGQPIAPSQFRRDQEALQLGGGDIIQNIGRAAGTAADTAFKAAERLQDRENADMVFRAEATLKDELAKFMRAESDKNGVDAWGAAERTNQWLGEAERKYSEGLTNDLQRRVFGQSLTKLRTHALDSMAKHENGQRNKSVSDAAEATIAGSINFAAANYSDGKAIDSAKGDILKRSAALGQLHGWTAEQRERFTSDKLTTMHLQVLENMMVANPDGARAYYQLNQGEIDGTKRNGVEKVIKASTTRARIQGIVDEVTGAGLTEAQSLERIRKEFSGDDEELAVIALKTRYKEQSDARERLQRDAADEAYGIFARTGKLSSIPPSLLAKLDGKVLIALRKDAKHLSEGTAPKTDPELYYLLRRLASDDPEAFKSRDLRQDFPRLGRGDREALIDLQTKADKPEQQRDLRTLSQQLNSAYSAMGLRSSDGEKKGLFERRAVEMIQDAQAKQGKPLDDTARQKIIDKLMVDGTVTINWWPDTRRRFYEVQGTPDKARFVPTIPRAERAQIDEAYMKQHKRKPTDQEAADLYKRRHGL